MNFIASKLGYEHIPEDVANKTFYDLKATLPGKDKALDFVSWFRCERGERRDDHGELNPLEADIVDRVSPLSKAKSS